MINRQIPSMSPKIGLNSLTASSTAKSILNRNFHNTSLRFVENDPEPNILMMRGKTLIAKKPTEISYAAAFRARDET